MKKTASIFSPLQTTRLPFPLPQMTGVKLLPRTQRFVQDAKRVPCIAERRKGRTQAFFVKTGAPAALDEAIVDRCWQQPQTKNLRDLQVLLTEHGLVKEMADGAKLVLEAFSETWVNMCCVTHEQHRSRSTRLGDVQCSCRHFRANPDQTRLWFFVFVPEFAKPGRPASLSTLPSILCWFRPRP